MFCPGFCDGVAGELVCFGFFVKNDADGEEFVKRVFLTDNCLGFEVGV